ncbi:MAG: protease modulator HflC [Planctomycetota bacterium]
MKFLAIAAAIVVALLLLLGGPLYTVRETEAVILTQFGKQAGEPVTEPGLHWKTPFVMNAHRLDKRVLEFDAPSTPMTTKDKTYLEVDTFGRWKIADFSVFYVALRDERTAQSRLEDIIGSEVRAAVAKHELIEIIRSDKSRVLPPDAQKQGAGGLQLPTAKRGRLEILEDVLREATPKLKPLGIELLDVRLKRVNYNADVLARIYTRMRSEREQIAQRFRSEGEGEAARVLGKKEKDLLEIESTANRRVLQLRGEADAEATRIYAEAYDKNQESRDFYRFLKTMETYRGVLAGKNLVLSTDSELFRMLKNAR